MEGLAHAIAWRVEQCSLRQLIAGLFMYSIDYTNSSRNNENEFVVGLPFQRCYFGSHLLCESLSGPTTLVQLRVPTTGTSNGAQYVLGTMRDCWASILGSFQCLPGVLSTERRRVVAQNKRDDVHVVRKSGFAYSMPLAS